MKSLLIKEGCINSEVKSELIKFYNTSNEYLENLRVQDDKVSKEYLKIVVEGADKYLRRRDIRILEVGCGTGYASFHLSKVFKDVIGIDISAKFIDYASTNFKRPNLIFKNEDACNLSFRESKFDALVSFDFIEHCCDVKKSLEEMYRVVNPGGLIIIFSPNLSSFYWPLRNLFFKKKHIYGNLSVRWIFKSFYISVKKFILNSKGFIYKTPLLNSQGIGLDLDSVYLSCPEDIRSFFKQKGSELLKTKRYTLKAQVSEKLLGCFAPSFVVMARKAGS